MSLTADLHLRVVGCILEDHELYRKPRLEGVKSLVLRAMRELAPQPASLRQIQEVLCFADTPLVSEVVLRQALNSLHRDDRKIELVSKAERVFRLLVEVPPSDDSLSSLLKDCWDRNFAACCGTSIDNFRRAVALLFARYGCAAYETLTSHNGSTVRTKDVVDSLGLSEPSAKEFFECFTEFVLSHHPADANLKLRLASAYVLLRMNGAGNWEKDALRSYFKGKILLLDTNILFEVIGRNLGQVIRMFDEIKGLGASLMIGTESITEFETALRRNAEQVVDLVKGGVDLLALIDEHLLRGDWIRALLEDNPTPNRTAIFQRVDKLLEQVEGILGSADISKLNLEQSVASDRRRERAEKIQEFAVETRHHRKHAEVALHDALLWEAIEDEPRLADLILTLDRSLGRVRVNGARIAIMLDEVVAYTLMGGAAEQELADIFSHTLSQDLQPDVAFLGMEDLLAIAGMESNLLNGPPRALRAAAYKLATIRAQRLASGEPIANDEIGRILVSSLSSYREDRALAEREREGRIAAEREMSQVREDYQQLKGNHEDCVALRAQMEALEERLQGLEAERASLKAEAQARAKREADAESQKTAIEEKTQKRRDWMLFAAFLLIGGVGLLALGILWAATISFCIATVSLLWAALAQETPSVSIPLAALIVSTLVGLAGALEKWPGARHMLGISQGLSELQAPASAPTATSTSNIRSTP